MEKCDSRSQILSQLRKRNLKEHSFQDLIKYSNKLLESLDFLQKETLYRKLQTTDQTVIDGSTHTESLKSEDSNLVSKCNNLQEDLKQCHIKISEYAQQLLELKNIVEVKNNLLTKQASELEQAQRELKNSKELNITYQKQISNMKVILQDKMDELDALNITFSSVEIKKNNLEIENKRLKDELLSFRSLEKNSGSSESSKSSSITSALLAAANDISVTKSSKISDIEKKEVSSPKSVHKQMSTSSVPSKVKHEFVAHDSDINAVLWLPQMSYFVTAGSDRKVKLWEMNNSKVELRESIRGCNSSILSVDIDPDANLLLCASSDFASRVWTMCDFMIRHTLTGHSGKVTSSKFMNEANRIVSGSSDQTLKMWDLRQRVCIVTYNTSAPVTDVVSRPSHLVISGHSDKKIRIWDPRIGSEITHVNCVKSVTSLDLSKNGYFLLASERSDCLKIFDMRQFKDICTLRGDGFEVGCDWTRAKFSPDNKYCCCGSKNGSVYVWNVASSTLERQLKAHSSNVISCCWSSCGSFLASCEKDKRCIIWS